MRPQPTVLFDLDGTLADTARDLCHTMNILLKLHGREAVPDSLVRNFLGAGARKIMERGFEATGAPATSAFLDQLFDEFLEHYSAHIADRTVLFPGVREQLNALSSAGARLAVCTNKPEHLTHRLLNALNVAHFFPVVIGGDTLDVRKPDPRHLYEAIERSGGTVEAAIMVGDSGPDIEAARAASLPSICVSFGYTDQPPATLGANLLIDHFDELPGALQSLLPHHFKP